MLRRDGLPTLERTDCRCRDFDQNLSQRRPGAGSDSVNGSPRSSCGCRLRDYTANGVQYCYCYYCYCYYLSSMPFSAASSRIVAQAPQRGQGLANKNGRSTNGTPTASVDAVVFPENYLISVIRCRPRMDRTALGVRQLQPRLE